MSSFLRIFGLLALLALPFACATAAPVDSHAADFAHKILSVSGANPLSLTFSDSSALTPSETQVAQAAIEAQLRASGVKLVDSRSPATPVKVTFSQNAKGWLWIAEIQQREQTKVVMLEIPAARNSDSAVHPSMSLRKQLLFTSDVPVLDVLYIDTADVRALLALSADQVIIYRPGAGGWVQQQSVPLGIYSTLPRDLRGHLVTASDHLFDAYLPGIVCASGASWPIAITCRTADDLWPLGGQNAFFNATRNYFTGLVRPGFTQPLAPFYSAASVVTAARSTWIFAGVGGQVQFTDGATEQLLAGTAGWGSDIASVHSSCGTGSQIIASGSENTPTSDSLRAFEILNQQAIPVSTAIAVNGPITALWTQQPSSTVTATVRSSGGFYETYAIDLSCD